MRPPSQGGGQNPLLRAFKPTVAVPQHSNVRHQQAAEQIHEHMLCAFPDADCTVDRIVVSQLLNRARTHIIRTLSTNPAEVERIVSPDLVVKLAMLAHDTREDGEADDAIDQQQKADEEAHLRRALEKVRFDKLEESHFTVYDALTYDSDGYPLVTPATIASLWEKSTHSVVSKEEIHEILEEDELLTSTSAGSDAVEDALESLFQFEARVVPGHLIGDFCIKVSRPVNKVRFSFSFAKDVLHSMRSLSTSLPYLILILVFFGMVANIDLWSRFAAYWNASTPEEWWTNWCTKGNTTSGPCYFHKRNIEDAISQEETYQFLRKEIVTDLWKYASSTQSAADVQFEGSWLIGALLFRTSPPTGFPSAPDAPIYDCAHLNLTQSEYEPRMSMSFDCRHWNSTLIPFSHTKEEALHLSEAYDLSVPSFTDASVIINYGMYSPSTGNVVWVAIMLTIPKFGGIIPRTRIHVMDSSMHAIIEMAFWFSIVIWILDLVSLVLLRRLKVGRAHAIASFGFRSFLLALIAAAYYYVQKVDVHGLLTVHHSIHGLDSVVNSSLLAEQLFSIWVLFLLLLFVQFIAYLDGFTIIVTLVVRIVPEVLGLLVVFGFMYVMFVNVAMILFGQGLEEYSTFFNANAELIQYFLLKFDLELLMENFPQSGFAFYYIFRIFLFYLVINFFIVTVIAPIRSVWLEGDLPIAVNNMLSKLEGDSMLGNLRVTAVRYGIMALDLIVGFIPLTLPYWIRGYEYLEDLYDPQSPLDELIVAVEALLTMRDDESVRVYATERARTLPVTKLANFDASYHLSLLLLLNETNNAWIRDARTMRLLASFDEFQTKMARELNPPEDESETVLPPLSLAHQLTASRKPPPVAKSDNKDTDAAGLVKVEKANSSSIPSLPGDAKSHDAPIVAAENPREHDGMEHSIELAETHGEAVKFHFTRFLLQQIRDHRHFRDWFYVLFSLIDRVIIFALYVTILVTVNHTERSVSHFVVNAHSGIKDLPLVQSCNDANCTSGFTKEWRYKDNRRLDHLRMFVDRRLQHSLFREADGEVPNLTGVSDAVAWDSYIAVNLPIEVRQLRAASTGCILPTVDSGADAAEELARQQLMQQTGLCGSTTLFSRQDMTYDPNSLLGTDAFKFQTRCSERDNAHVYGVHFRSIPCEGFTALVNNAEQLLDAVNNWIDGQTRVVAISLVLEHHRKSSLNAGEEGIKLQYLMYAELSEGGSAGQFFVRTTPLSDPDLDDINHVGLVLMAIDFVLAVLEVLIPIAHCIVHRRWAALRKQTFLSLRIVVFIVYMAIRSQDTHGGVSWPRLGMGVISVIWLSYECLFLVIFPFTQFFFRRVTIVNHFIRLTFVKVVLLIPVFAVILSAFAIAGYLLWAGRLEAFSTMHRSFFTISQGLLGDFEFKEMYHLNASFAMIYMTLFLVIVIIVLLNMLLAIIAGCADESREESQVVAPIEVIAQVMSRRVYFGPLVGVIMMFLISESEDREHKQTKVADDEPTAADSPRIHVTKPRTAKMVRVPEQGDQQDAKVEDIATDEVPTNEGGQAAHEKAASGVDVVLPAAEHPTAGADQDHHQHPDTAASHHDAAARLKLRDNVHRVIEHNTQRHPSHKAAEEFDMDDLGGREVLHKPSTWMQLIASLFEVQRKSGRREIPRFHILENNRIPTPLECLLPRLGPLLLSEVVHVLHLVHRPEAMQCSFVAYILAMHQHFQQSHPALFALDCESDEELQIQVLGAWHLERAAHLAQSGDDHSASNPKHPHGALLKPDALLAHSRSGNNSVDVSTSHFSSQSFDHNSSAWKKAAKKGKGKLEVFEHMAMQSSAAGGMESLLMSVAAKRGSNLNIAASPSRQSGNSDPGMPTASSAERQHS